MEILLFLQIKRMHFRNKQTKNNLNYHFHKLKHQNDRSHFTVLLLRLFQSLSGKEIELILTNR